MKTEGFSSFVILFPMGLATSAGSCVSVVICICVFIWMQRKEEKMENCSVNKKRRSSENEKNWRLLKEKLITDCDKLRMQFVLN